MANRETREVHIKVTSNEKGMKTANKQTNKLKGGLAGVAGAATAATGGIRAMAAALISSGIGAVVLALGSMVAFLGKTMSLSRSFEKSLSRLGAITGASADEMTRLSDSAQRFGATTEFTASQVVEMQTELAKLGFNTEEILAATGGALSLASAAGTGLAEAAEVTAGVLNGFGMAASDIGEVVDVMAMSFNSSALDMDKFRESMKMVAPIASTVGESVSSTTAALGVLADNQIAGSMAGTNLRKVLMGLEKEFGGGLATQLDSFKERLDTATTRSQKLEMATKLVGERMAGALIILAENNEKYDELKVKLDGASVAGIKLANTTKSATDVLTDFGTSTNYISRVVDVMSTSLNSSDLDMEKFRESMKMVSPIASNLGESITSTTAALGILADNQIKGYEAGTSMREIFTKLEETFGGNLQTQLSKVNNKLESTTDSSKKLAIAEEIVGERFAGTLIKLAQNSEAYANLKSKLEEASVASIGLANASEVARGVLGDFGMSTDYINEVVGIMATSFDSSSLGIDDFTESMKLVAPVASDVGESIKSTTAALSVLSDNQIKGSVAGNNLRGVLESLEKEFGGGLATQLDSFKDRLSSATTENQKLEMATELVGETMADTLIVLAENNEKYDELKVKLDGASEAYDGLGAAQQMANKQLDNLDGDLKILNSTWEGFMLGIEDGDGVMNSLARKGVQFLTKAINGLNKGVEKVSFYFTDLREGLKESALGIGATVAGLFRKMTLKVEEFVTKAKLKMSEVPLIGGAIDEEAAKANLKRIEEDLNKANALIDKGAEYRNMANGRALTREARFQEKYNKAAEEIRTKARKKREAEIEEEESQEDENNKASIAKKKAFLDKLAKAEADQEAKTQAEKIELARKRHLDELAKIEMNTKEKREAENRINAIYDDKQKELRKQKELEADKERADQLIKKSEEQITELEKENGDFENRLMRLDAQRTLLLMNDNLTEQQRTELLQKNAAARVRVEEAQADSRLAIMNKVANYMSGFAELAGKNTQEGKAIAVATALINTYAGMSEVWSKKGSSPFVSASIAEKIAASATVLATGMKTIKSIKSVKVPNGGGATGGGSAPTGVQAPSFNVIGQTSVGEQLIADAVGQSNQQPVQAYVVESQMTSAQELNRNVEENASLG